uniref:Glycosyltransferase n=1 Tax=Allium cepa TaxID=4679 RepID=Q7XJ51_ALLCE|nr:flavonoid glucosyl-transferase [Allium cepa]
MSIKSKTEASKADHYVLVPLMAQGHMIPMLDIARLLANRGAWVSFITTPVNATRIKPLLDDRKSNNEFINVVELTFPCKEFGLPLGCENVDLITSVDQYKPFFHAAISLFEPLKLYIREATPTVTCIISDYSCFFTAEVGQSLNIPRIIFHGPSCLFIHGTHSIRIHNSFDGVAEFDSIAVPDLPKKIEMNKQQAWGCFSDPGWEDFQAKAAEAEASSFGVVMNTCYELESEIINRYEKLIKKRVWPIGPLCLYGNHTGLKGDRGKKSSVDEAQLLNWLDSKEAKSVLYISFGSLVRTKTSQLIEIGLGLENSKVPFIWVIKEIERTVEFEKWISTERFEEKTKGRGFVITGWAPQVVILSHGSVGGFVTHCGWNSVLEAVSAGVPMLTWPHFADQFFNEKLIVEVIETGVAVGVNKPYFYLLEDEVAVKSEVISKAVLQLMDKGEEGEERRRRAKQYGDKGRKAMDDGGSSWMNLRLFMDFMSPKV